MIRLTPEALRAARALLNMSQREAAAALGVSPATVNTIENGGAFQAGTGERIIGRFAALGVEVLDAAAPGARMKPRD